MRQLRLLLATILLLLGTGSLLAETVANLPKPTGYVNDFAGVLDAGAKQNLELRCRELNEQAHAQLAIVTIHTLGGEPIDDFASKLEEKWKVGRKGTDRGVLMVFAIDDHKRWIEVGYGIEGILNDAKVGDIGRSMVPALKQKQYALAMEVGVQQIANVIALDAGVTLTHHFAAAPPAVPKKHGLDTGAIVVLSIFGGVFLLFPVIDLLAYLRSGGFSTSAGSTIIDPDGGIPSSTGSDSNSISSFTGDNSGTGSSFTSDSPSSSSDFSGFDGGSSGGGGAGGDW